jgi:hypothetical protein
LRRRALHRSTHAHAVDRLMQSSPSSFLFNVLLIKSGIPGRTSSSTAATSAGSIVVLTSWQKLSMIKDPKNADTSAEWRAKIQQNNIRNSNNYNYNYIKVNKIDVDDMDVDNDKKAVTAVVQNVTPSNTDEDILDFDDSRRRDGVKFTVNMIKIPKYKHDNHNNQ